MKVFKLEPLSIKETAKGDYVIARMDVYVDGRLTNSQFVRLPVDATTDEIYGLLVGKRGHGPVWVQWPLPLQPPKVETDDLEQ